jgi:Raf kinase inhibitor-like YbhB/YbcL family protein
MLERFLSWLLRNVHAGQDKLAWNDSALAGVPASIVLSSSAFASGETIPPRYAGRGAGDNVSPPLAWSNVPPAAAELVLVLEDPDAPMPRPFVHLIATGIDPQTNALVEGALSNAEKPARLRLGRNTAGRAAYMGPRALRGHGPHRYVFQLFALDSRLNFDNPPKLAELKKAMQGHVLARGRLDGCFRRD